MKKFSGRELFDFETGRAIGGKVLYGFFQPPVDPVDNDVDDGSRPENSDVAGTFGDQGVV